MQKNRAMCIIVGGGGGALSKRCDVAASFVVQAVTPRASQKRTCPIPFHFGRERRAYGGLCFTSLVNTIPSQPLLLLPNSIVIPCPRIIFITADRAERNSLGTFTLCAQQTRSLLSVPLCSCPPGRNVGSSRSD